ncbi:hypothetical protein F5B18DRAFT_251440 [Nemania serpens]|nr:hypothetical protein F5B18DRAFT_251440 [Nemania serpens]
MSYDFRLPEGGDKPKRYSMPNGSFRPDMGVRIEFRERNAATQEDRRERSRSIQKPSAMVSDLTSRNEDTQEGRIQLKYVDEVTRSTVHLRKVTPFRGLAQALEFVVTPSVALTEHFRVRAALCQEYRHTPSGLCKHATSMLIPE